MVAEVATWVKLFTHFLMVMFSAQHTISWTEGTWEKKEAAEVREGGFFLYFTIDVNEGRKAKEALKRAGVLCNKVLDGPQNYSSATVLFK